MTTNPKPILGEIEQIFEVEFAWTDEGVFLRYFDGVEFFPSKNSAMERIQDLVISVLVSQVNDLRRHLDPIPEAMLLNEQTSNKVSSPDVTWQLLSLTIKTDLREKSGRMGAEWSVKINDRVQKVRGERPYGSLKATAAQLAKSECKRLIKR